MQTNQNNSKTIEKFESGFIITIIENNWKKIAHYSTPCNINYNGRNIELHNDFLIDYNSYQNPRTFSGRDFDDILLSLLEHGKLLPK